MQIALNFFSQFKGLKFKRVEKNPVLYKYFWKMQIALNFFSQFKKYGMWHYTIGSKKL